MDNTCPFHIKKYRLDRRIATGGMGEVYLAQDTELERPVAVKLIHRDRLEDSDIRLLFEKEAKATARLQHRAIVRIYDFLRWQDHECLVMEYLEGQSFKAFLGGEGNSTPERILPIFLDVVEGLAHAHHQGIVHRDLKPGNLWMTPEGQVKILDFGLAKHVEQETSLLDGRVVGTPYYMSPQQASGDRLDLRTDLFSLGIIFYEALTGVHPFKGDSPRETQANLKGGRQVPASEINDTIPEEISSLVDRLLAKNPAKRPQSADEVAEILASTLDQPRLPSSATRRERWTRVRLSLVVLALMVALATVVYFLLFSQDPEPRPSIVVLGNTRDDDPWVATAVVEILTAHLGGDDALLALPSLHSTYVPAPKALTQGAMEDLRTALRVDHFVLSEASRADDAWHVRLRLVDAHQGKVHAEASIETTAVEDELEALLENAAIQLRARLGHGALAPDALRGARASFPDGAASRFYAEGLVASRRHQPRTARTAFAQAIASAPDAPMPYLAQAMALTALGELDAAGVTGSRAEQRSEPLGTSLRHEISARNTAVAGDWPTATEFHRANFERHPDVLRHGRHLAEALLHQGKAKPARDMLAGLREHSLSRLDDGKLDLVAAFTAFHLGALSWARAAASQAIEIGETLTAPRLIAEAQLVLSMTLTRLGERDDADRAWDAARIAAAQTGDRLILLDAFSLGLDSLIYRGQIHEALRQFQRHRELYREAGDRLHEARMAHNLATALMDRDPDAATLLLSDARAIFSRLDLHKHAAAAEYGLGFLAQLRGNLAAAHSHYRIALDVFTELDDKVYRAVVLNGLGELAFFAADFEQALSLHDQALAINNALPRPSGVAYNTFRIAEVQRHQNKPEMAHQNYLKALDVREELGDLLGAAETRIGLARLELARQNFGNAHAEARKASRAMLDRGAMDLFILARITEAQVYLAQGELETSRALLDEIELHAQQSVDRRVGYEVRLLAAHLSEDSQELSKRLEQLAANAAAGGDLLYAAEARRVKGTLSGAVRK